MSHASYPNRLNVGAIMERLGEAIAAAEHQSIPRTAIKGAEKEHLVTL